MSEGSETLSAQGSEPVSPAVIAPAEPAKNAAIPVPVINQGSFPRKHSGSWWTIPLLCAGLSLIACAWIIGQVEDNRQLAWQKNKLQTDLEHFQKQIETNHDFLERLSNDANLVERLAQRQMKWVRQGAAVLELGGTTALEDTSPFRLVNIPPPPAVKPYERAGGMLTAVFYHPRVRLYAYGLGAFLIAVSLITGASDTRPGDE